MTEDRVRTLKSRFALRLQHHIVCDREQVTQSLPAQAPPSAKWGSGIRYGCFEDKMLEHVTKFEYKTIWPFSVLFLLYIHIPLTLKCRR